MFKMFQQVKALNMSPTEEPPVKSGQGSAGSNEIIEEENEADTGGSNAHFNYGKVEKSFR